jgi:hypothetical protein
VTRNHRFLLRLHLNQIDALGAAIATVDAQVEKILGPFRTAVELVMSVPGIKNLSAQVIVSEIGTDMSRFPSDKDQIDLYEHIDDPAYLAKEETFKSW